MGKLVQLQSFLEMSISPCDSILKNNGHNFDDIRKDLDDLRAAIDAIHEKTRRLHHELVERMNEQEHKKQANRRGLMGVDCG